MQAVAENEIHPTASNTITVSMETVAVVLLAAIALFIYLAGLGLVPLTPAEAPQALATWRAVSPDAAGTAVPSDNAMVFWAQRLGFAMFGVGDSSARIFTAFAGVLLSLSPLLFRELIGKPRAYMLALLLVFSPVVMASARLSGGTTWTLLYAVGGLWAAWQYWQSQAGGVFYGVLAVVAFGVMMFLTGPAGPLLALILVAAGLVALFLSALDSPDDLPGDEYLAQVQARLRDWPWLSGLSVAVGVVVAVSTGFLLYPGGLSMVAAALGSFMSGFADRPEGVPLFWPLLTSLLYELWLWVFAIMAVIMLNRRGILTFVERFLAAWVILAGLMALFYQGGEASFALLMGVPLAGLAAYLAADALSRSDAPVLWFDEVLEEDHQLRWTHWLVSVVMFALLVMTAVHLQVIATGILNVPDGSISQLFSRIGEPAFNNVARSLIWLFISILFIVVGYFLVASIWGNLAALRAGVLGAFAFVLMSGMASGWHITVEDADNPAELWHIEATATDAVLLRETLDELAFRETQGFPQLPVMAVAEDDSLLAWLLRDYDNARFVDDISQARTQEVIIAPESDIEPDLGGSYLGQPFILTRTWDVASMQGFDVLAWWAIRDVRFAPEPVQRFVLWVRQDIFNSNPFTALPTSG